MPYAPARPPWCTARTSGSCASGSAAIGVAGARAGPRSVRGRGRREFLAGEPRRPRGRSRRPAAGTTARASRVVTDAGGRRRLAGGTRTVPVCWSRSSSPFTRELSVLVARSPSGQAVAYPVVESVQVDGICREVYAPAPGLHRGPRARRAARPRCGSPGELEVTGLMAVELFDTPDGVLRQRARAAPAQHRPLDDRRCGDQPVRAAPARGARPAARARRRRSRRTP